jgi:hypothetical protein
LLKNSNPNRKPIYTTHLTSVDEFLTTTGFQNSWPAFKQRLEEMNHTNPTGSRSGDAVTVSDGSVGYLTVNNQSDVFPGWHGGPSMAIIHSHRTGYMLSQLTAMKNG